MSAHPMHALILGHKHETNMAESFSAHHMTWLIFPLWRTLFVFHISTNTSLHPSLEDHPHTDMPKGGQGDALHAPAPVSVTPGMGFSSHGASGQPSGLLGEFFAPIKLPGEPHTFYIKESAQGDSQQLYTRDPHTGAYRQSSKQALPDGKGGWQRDGGLKGGLNYTPEDRAKRLEEARTECQQTAEVLAMLQDRVTAARNKFHSAQDEISKQLAHIDLLIAINAHSRIAEHFRQVQDELTNALY